MSIQTTTAETATVDRRPVWLTKAADFVELTKPRIAVMVLVTVAVAAALSSWGQISPVQLAWLLLGTTFVAASASAGNQLLERRVDSLMDRTRHRPLPAARLSMMEVTVFAGVSLFLGATLLAAAISWQAASWSLATWVLYVLVYTPLKTRTVFNTHVGAVAGAIPVLIGWSAGGSPLDVRAATLFLLVYLWQFPHFMAIAWLYRVDYAGAGLKMMPVVDPSGRRAGVLAVCGALALILATLAPATFANPYGAVYLSVAVLLGVGQLVFAMLFFAKRDDITARWLLRASLIYLPAMLAALVLAA